MGAIYSAVGRTIDRRLEELGATRLCPRGEGDDAHSFVIDNILLVVLLLTAASSTALMTISKNGVLLFGST
jgi:sulfite reductase alpha subunit-like flavoprotein